MDNNALHAADNIISAVANNPGKSTIEILNGIALMTIRDRAGTFIGGRMGRPEKAKMRELKGSPHCLFPIGDEGGVFRSFQAANEKGIVTSHFPRYLCWQCDKETIYPICETCKSKTHRIYECVQCGDLQTKECPTHGPCKTYNRREIRIKEYFKAALSWMGMRQYPDLIKGLRGTPNADHIPENLAKGILRAKHGVYAAECCMTK